MFSDDAPALTATFHDYESRIAIPNGVPVYLAADVNVEKLRLSWSLDGTNWNTIEQDFDASLISDEAGKGENANFTGAFVGVCCQDIEGTRLHADFDYLNYFPGN